MGIVVMGVGFCGSFSTSTGLSYREMIARAAQAAYNEAGLTAEQIDGAVSVEEDLISGYSIADEYVPDQLAMVRKPVYTIPGDFLHGLGSAVMQLKAGRHKTLVVESYCKASNILTKDEILHFALDPIFNRFGVSPHFLAGIEVQQFLDRTGFGLEDLAEVVIRNKRAALSNPLAPYSGQFDIDDIINGRPVAAPITEGMIARHADAAIAVVIGVEEAAETAEKPVWISGTGWASANSIIERRDHSISEGTMLAADMAYKEAKVQLPNKEIDVAYVSDLYPHRQLMHMEALGLDDDFLPFVNPDGGAQGGGDLFEATSGARFYDAVRMLRGEAGAHQIEGVKSAVVQGWRGLPTDSAAVVVLDGEGR